MATPVFSCGFECRISGIGHWDDWVDGGATVTAQNTYARNGGYALRIQATADAARLRHLTASSQTILVVRFYLYFVTLPTADVSDLASLITGVPTTYSLGFTQSTSKLNFGVSGGSKTAGPTISAGVWYRIDIRGDISSNPHVFDWQVDGSAQTQVTNAIAATTWYGSYLGAETAVGTFDACYDDYIESNTTGDYPFGAGYTVGYLVGSTSGTHDQTSGDLQNEASSNVTNGDSSGDKVNEAVADTTSYVKQVVARGSTYWEGIYATSGASAAPRAVDQLVATRAVTAGTNDQKAQLYDGTSAADAYSLTSTPSATLLYQRKQWATAPSTGAWTAGKFQAARIRWGFSTTNTATYPPAISWTMLEAEFSGDLSTAPVWTTPADTVTIGTNPELKFNSPASAVKQHFQIQLDTADTFDTGDLRTIDSSTDQTGWTYWNGSTWAALPSDGLPVAYAGNEVDYTVQTALSATTWYRRVRAGVQV